MMAKHSQNRANVDAAGTQQIETIRDAPFQDSLMGTGSGGALVSQPHAGSKPPAMLCVTLVSKAVLEDVEGWSWLAKQDAFFQPIPECISSPGIPVALQRVKGVILPKFKPDYIIRALLMIETLLLGQDRVIWGADNRRDIPYPLSIVAKTAKRLNLGHSV